MSLVTRCPACATLFKVVPDQLRISDGWVRCGRCGEVFDGAVQVEAAPPSETVQPAPPLAVADTTAPVLAVAPPAAPAAARSQAAPPAGIGVPPHWKEAFVDLQFTPLPTEIVAAPTPPDRPATALVANRPSQAASPVSARADGEPPAWSASTQRVLHRPASTRSEWPALPENDGSAPAVPPYYTAGQPLATTVPTQAPGAPLQPADAAIEAATETGLPDDTPSALLLHTASEDVPELQLEASASSFVPSKPPRLDDAEIEAMLHPPLSFVRDAQRKAFWRRRSVRALLGLACLTLLAGLGLQAMVQERDWLAAAVPRARPALDALCVPLGCRIAPRRRIDAVAIDSSSFNRVRGDNYQLRLVLKNTAATSVATPALELTLTDTAEQAVLRRVLLPAELGAAPALVAGGEWTGQWTVALGAAGGGVPRVAGYRLLAFYP